MKVVFQNNGVADILALTTMGVSVKEAGSIGYFGTGFKFAIATLLRTGHKVYLRSGTEYYKFASEQTKIRGQEFNMVTMNGVSLGFTTMLGRDWMCWMAYRELACNAFDEGGTVFLASDNVDHSPDQTTIIVIGEGIVGAHHERDEIFFTGSGNMRRVPSNKIYYRGVRVFDAPCVNTYNITGSITLSEDRHAKHEHELRYEIAKIIAHSDDCDAVYLALREKEMFESGLDYDYMSFNPSETFVNVASAIIANRESTNVSVRKLLSRIGRLDETDNEITLDAVQRQQLKKAMSFIKKTMGYDITYPISVVEKIDGGSLGAANRPQNKITLSVRVFEQGTKQVAATLLEEFMHLRFGYNDCTYAFQNALFDHIITLGERLNKKPL